MSRLVLRRALRIQQGRLIDKSSPICTNNNSQVIQPQISNHQLVATRNFFFFEEKEDKRIRDIQVNPKGIGSKIKPGDLVDKLYEKTGNVRTLPTSLAFGYFWMIKE